MSLATSKIFKDKLHKDKTIPDTLERLRVLGMESVYAYAPELRKLITEAEEDDMEWLMMMKAYFSLDPTINFIEKFRMKKVFKGALRNSWGITNKEGLIVEINSLLDGGNSSYANIQMNLYWELMAKGLEATDENIRESEIFNKFYYDEENRSEEEYKKDIEYLKGALNIINSSSHLLTKNWVLGFDLSRAVHLTRMGYVVGLISEKEAWNIIDEIYDYFIEFDTYRDFFYSDELGNRLFDYDRKLDALNLLKIRMENLVPILVDKHTPFKYLTISDAITEQPVEIYKSMFGIKKLESIKNKSYKKL